MIFPRQSNGNTAVARIVVAQCPALRSFNIFRQQTARVHLVIKSVRSANIATPMHRMVEGIFARKIVPNPLSHLIVEFVQSKRMILYLRQ